MSRVSDGQGLRVAPTIVVTAAVIERDGAFLVARRQNGVHLAGYWEFPGGKCDPDESLTACLVRELREELGLVVDPAETEYIGSYRAVAANEENTVVRAEVFFLTTSELPVAGAEIDELLWVERLDDLAVEVAPLSRDSLLPLWAARSSTLF